MQEGISILVIGGGGREHALAWKLAQSPKVGQIWVAPGNGGTLNAGKQNGIATINNVDIAENDFEALIRFAHEASVYLTVVGPEVPLAAGIGDAFQAAGLRCFGPSAAAARIEGSKDFAKAFMDRHRIPTARYKTFTDHESACQHLRTIDYDVVIKASGLAAGKGVILPQSLTEGEEALHQIMQEQRFGTAGETVVIEERLRGQEASILAFCDGKTVVAMPPAQDHKRIFDGDQGPNTGGMGAYAPAPLVPKTLQDEVIRTILQPTIDGLSQENASFVGVLFAGLMITLDGPQVLEFNCRFGDPETQVLLPLLETDLVDVIEACLDGRLDQTDIQWRFGAAATVVAASEGYPEGYPKGRVIAGIEDAAALKDTVVFQAGTYQAEHHELVTNGGRVLAVTGVGTTLTQAIAQAYAGMDQICFEGIHFRRDIGAKALGEGQKR
ncbi:MAG: phosphoribosylamine--glycine ligase [Chloroflexota bacterium]